MKRNLWRFLALGFLSSALKSPSAGVPFRLGSPFLDPSSCFWAFAAASLCQRSNTWRRHSRSASSGSEGSALAISLGGSGAATGFGAVLGLKVLGVDFLIGATAGLG